MLTCTPLPCRPPRANPSTARDSPEKKQRARARAPYRSRESDSRLESLQGTEDEVSSAEISSGVLTPLADCALHLQLAKTAVKPATSCSRAAPRSTAISRW